MSDSRKYIVALDQGTTSSRSVIFDRDARIVATSGHEFTQYYPKTGWVEHDPMEIWATQSGSLTEVLARSGIGSHEIAAIGITNQRETVVVWDKQTGVPVYNAIVWQCRRTASMCQQMKTDGIEELIREKTGLVIDPYFSATKLKWILDNVANAKKKAEKGKLLFGTIDTWIVWKMTQGKVHVTDFTNASRTMLFNIRTLQWDQELLDYFGIPASMLPEVKSSSEIYGRTNIGGKGGTRIPIAGIAGDQQSALFGQLCIEKGTVKNTYGTGCFMLMNTGEKPVISRNGLLTTLAVGPEAQVHYALEGSVFMGGATIQWLRDGLRLIHDASDSGYFAGQTEDTAGVYLVPAFTGLGAPHWDPAARGTLIGLTRGTNRNHIIRAALEAIAYQCRDVMDAMQKDARTTLSFIKADGGAAANDFLMQFQADIMGTRVVRTSVIESTAVGAAFLAGLAAGFWKDITTLETTVQEGKTFSPSMDNALRKEKYNNWKRAVARAGNWTQT